MKIKVDKKLIFILGLFLLLFLPSLFEPLSYGDECIYLTLGNALRAGRVFYKNIHDNKPPLLYLVAAASFGRLFWFRLISLAWNLVHLTIIYKIIVRLTKKRSLGLIGGLIFTTGYLLLEGRIANGENFMMMPISLAVYLLIKKKNKNFIFGLLIGLLFSIGFLFKVPAGFDFIAIIFGFYFLKVKAIKLASFAKIRKQKSFWGIIIGFVSPIVISIIYYAAHGAFVPYVRSALMQNIGYLSSWQGSNIGLIIRFCLLAISALIIFIFREKLSFWPSLFAFWFVFALFGALLSGRPYPHYLIEVIPSLTLLISLTIKSFSKQLIILSAIAIAVLGFSYYYFNFWYYPVIPYYKNFFSFVSGQKTKNEYFKYWGDQVLQNYKLAKFIKTTSNKNDSIFAWGEGSCVYALSDRLPPGRFTVNYHIFDFDGFDQTLSAIKQKLPPIVIKMNKEKRRWLELDELLQQQYYLLHHPEIESTIFIKK